MKIKKGIDGGIYAVFHNEDEADKYAWFFGGILRCNVACFGQLLNAWRIL